MHSLVVAVEAIDPLVVTGKVAGVNGLLIESKGGLSRLAVMDRGRRRRHPDRGKIGQSVSNAIPS